MNILKIHEQIHALLREGIKSIVNEGKQKDTFHQRPCSKRHTIQYIVEIISCDHFTRLNDSVFLLMSESVSPATPAPLSVDRCFGGAREVLQYSSHAFLIPWTDWN